MKNRTKIKACFLPTTGLSAQRLKDGVIFQDDEVPSQIAQDYVLSRCWWLRTPKLTEYMLLLYESLKTLDAVSPTVHRICWCIELGTAPKKTCPKFQKTWCACSVSSGIRMKVDFIFCSILFPAGLESRLGKGTKYRMLCTHLLTPSDQPQEQANARPQRWSKINSYRYCWCRTRPRNCWILAREKAQRLARQGCQSCPPVFHWGFQLRHDVPG